MILGSVLLFVVLVLYVGTVSTLANLHGSDAAGNGLAQVFGVAMTIALWIALGILLAVALAKGQAPRWSAIIASLMVPASGAAALSTAWLLADNFYRSKWPLVVPALAPLLLCAIAAWLLYPAFRSLLPTTTVSTITWAAVGTLSVLPWPTVLYRSRHGAEDRAAAAAAWKAGEPARLEAERQARQQAFRRLGPETPLRDWLEYCSPGDELRAAAFAAIRRSPRRQADAEAMINGGLGYFWDDLPELDLQPTEPIKMGAKKFLREKIADLEPRDPTDPPSFAYLVERIDPYLLAIRWISENHCGCEVEIAHLIAVVRKYSPCPKRERVLAFLAGTVSPPGS